MSHIRAALLGASPILNAMAFVAFLSAAALLAACATPLHGRNSTQLNDNREVISAAFARWQAGTGGPYELLADDVEWTIVGSSPLSKAFRSRQEFLGEVIHPFNARLSAPLVPRVWRIYADGDTVIVLFDAAAMARDGKPYCNTYSWCLQMAEGRIVKAVAFFDTRLFDEFWTRVAPAQ